MFFSIVHNNVAMDAHNSIPRMLASNKGGLLKIMINKTLSMLIELYCVCRYVSPWFCNPQFSSWLQCIDYLKKKRKRFLSSWVASLPVCSGGERLHPAAGEGGLHRAAEGHRGQGGGHAERGHGGRAELGPGRQPPAEPGSWDPHDVRGEGRGEDEWGCQRGNRVVVRECPCLGYVSPGATGRRMCSQASQPDSMCQKLKPKARNAADVTLLVAVFSICGLASWIGLS